MSIRSTHTMSPESMMKWMHKVRIGEIQTNGKEINALIKPMLKQYKRYINVLVGCAYILRQLGLSNQDHQELQDIVDSAATARETDFYLPEIIICWDEKAKFVIDSIKTKSGLSREAYNNLRTCAHNLLWDQFVIRANYTLLKRHIAFVVNSSCTRTLYKYDFLTPGDLQTMAKDLREKANRYGSGKREKLEEALRKEKEELDGWFNDLDGQVMVHREGDHESQFKRLRDWRPEDPEAFFVKQDRQGFLRLRAQNYISGTQDSSPTEVVNNRSSADDGQRASTACTSTGRTSGMSSLTASPGDTSAPRAIKLERPPGAFKAMRTSPTPHPPSSIVPTPYSPEETTSPGKAPTSEGSGVSTADLPTRSQIRSTMSGTSSKHWPIEGAELDMSSLSRASTVCGSTPSVKSKLESEVHYNPSPSTVKLTLEDDTSSSTQNSQWLTNSPSPSPSFLGGKSDDSPDPWRDDTTPVQGLTVRGLSESSGGETDHTQFGGMDNPASWRTGQNLALPGNGLTTIEMRTDETLGEKSMAAQELLRDLDAAAEQTARARLQSLLDRYGKEDMVDPCRAFWCSRVDDIAISEELCCLMNQEHAANALDALKGVEGAIVKLEYAVVVGKIFGDLRYKPIIGAVSTYYAPHKLDGNQRLDEIRRRTCSGHLGTTGAFSHVDPNGECDTTVAVDCGTLLVLTVTDDDARGITATPVTSNKEFHVRAGTTWATLVVEDCCWSAYLSCGEDKAKQLVQRWVLEEVSYGKVGYGAAAGHKREPFDPASTYPCKRQIQDWAAFPNFSGVLT